MRPVVVTLVLALMGAAHPAAAQPSVRPVVSHDTDSAQAALVGQYCVGCHSQRGKAGGLVLEGLALTEVGRHAEVWEKAVRKVRTGLMPPPGRPRPPAAALDDFAGWLERSLDAAAAAAPDPGRVGLRRLNRSEYANAIADVLDLEIDAAALLPKDQESEGFDTNASALRVSPSFLDQYMVAARLVSDRAIGTPSPKPGSVMLRPARGTDQSRQLPGLPPGTRGGLAVRHLFPADGDYTFNIPGLAGAFYVRGMEYAHTLVLMLDGVKVFEGRIGGEEDMRAIDQKQAPAVAAINARFQNIKARVTAGPHDVAVTFVARSMAESDEMLYSFRPGSLEDRIARIGGLEIVGPFAPTGISDTPSRRRIFTCRPAPGATAAAERRCATRIFTALASGAYRHPASEHEASVPLAFYDEARKDGDFEAGIRGGLTAILANPRFLFRAERVPSGVAAGTAHRLDALDLATRLSSFLRGRAPDQALTEAAMSGRLEQPAVLEQQVRRLLAGPQARANLARFTTQWLKLGGLDDIEPDGLQFPNFDPGLREAFKREIELFVNDIATGNRSVVDLLTGDSTYLNERLALHYGVPGVRGSAFQRVTLHDANRWGLLGKGAVLMATSYGNRTSPIVRGAWVLDVLMGLAPASPPTDVEGFKENVPGEKARTIREIFEEHRRNPACAACHNVMDPLGFALENFDALGAWRTRDLWADADIDAGGQMIDGTPLGSPRELSRVLAARPEPFVRAFVERLMTFGLGRTIEATDMPVVRTIVRDAAPGGYRYADLVLGIVKSAPFQMRRVGSPSGTATAAAPAR